jgi:carbon monoxide dehydrogenase subunit G
LRVEGRYTIAAPIERVWAALQDPEALRRCIPGCEALAPAGVDRYEARGRVPVPGFGEAYEGQVVLSDKEPPRRYRLSVQTGGPHAVRGDALVELTATGEATLVRVTADGHLGGAMAGFGQRLLGGVAKGLLNQVFECIKRRVEADGG